jgi:outer membrane protein assembly factor BamA
VLLEAEADYTHGLGSDPSSYFRLRGAATLHIDLWARSRVLVFRVATVAVAPTGNEIVPFSELAVLGGPDDLRGFRIEAFRDSTSLIGSAEYRWPVFMWADGVLFADYGGVFGSWYAGIGPAQMQPDVGLGVRFHTGDRFYLRAQVAYGFGDTWQFYISGANLP